MKIVTTWVDARLAIDDNGTSGLVPTMGFLHEGHVRLFAEAEASCDVVICSIFVNPLQFGEDADLAAYPRDLKRDVEIAEAGGVDVVFAPSVDQVYQRRLSTTVSIEGVSSGMEGEFRPGHFAGVAVMVAKLFAGIQPDRAFFGRKDAQQLAVIATMAQDLSFPVEVVGVPTLREHDGLALSSRNTRIDANQRYQATSLSRGLFAAAKLLDDGVRDADTLIHAAATEMNGAGVSPEYIQLASQSTAERLTVVDRPAFLASAAWVGGIRLIDNLHIGFVDGVIEPDRGTTLSSPSILYGGS